MKSWIWIRIQMVRILKTGSYKLFFLDDEEDLVLVNKKRTIVPSGQPAGKIL